MTTNHSTALSAGGNPALAPLEMPTPTRRAPSDAVVAGEEISPEQLEGYRRELTGYSYRILGSIHEAEDAVQDTLVRAWRGLARFEDRGGLRPWLYRIATNVCLDLLKGRNRRALPMALVPAATGELSLGAPRPQATWVEPAPDNLLMPAGRDPGDPAELAVARETVRLAFVAVLQHLVPRQRAVLVLRDVLRWKAKEVAELLDTSAVAVNSTLRRARATLAAANLGAAPREPSDTEQDVLARYVDAFERFDVDALVTLLRDDVTLDMPPFELWLRGPQDIRRWVLASAECRHNRLIPIAANGSPAVAVYRPSGPAGALTPFAIHLLQISGDRIAAIHAYLDPTLFAVFGLPTDPGAEAC